MNEAVLSKNIMKCLIENFGVVETERFISLVIREPFDYTEWQKNLYNDMSIEELFAVAADFKNISFNGD